MLQYFSDGSLFQVADCDVAHGFLRILARDGRDLAVASQDGGLGGAVGRWQVCGDWRLCDEPHELLDGESQDAKHQVAEYLIVSPHAYIIGAVVVFQAAVDPFGGGALVVAAFFGQLIVGAAFGPRFSCTLSLGATPWFGIDDRNMTERPARSVDFRRIIGAVHELVEIGHTLRGDLRQRDCDLTVMQRRRRQQTRRRKCRCPARSCR